VTSAPLTRITKRTTYFRNRPPRVVIGSSGFRRTGRVAG
jgi:hypothetical protein